MPLREGGGAPALVGKNKNNDQVIVYAAGRCGTVWYQLQVYSHNFVFICTRRISDTVHTTVKNIYLFPLVNFYCTTGNFNVIYRLSFLLSLCVNFVMQFIFTYIYGNFLPDTFDPLGTGYYVVDNVYQTFTNYLEKVCQMSTKTSSVHLINSVVQEELINIIFIILFNLYVLKFNFRVRCLFTFNCLLKRQFPLHRGGHSESFVALEMVSKFVLITKWQVQLM